MSSIRPPPYEPFGCDRLRQALWSGLQVGAASAEERVEAAPKVGAPIAYDELLRDSRELGVRLLGGYELGDGLDGLDDIEDIGAPGGKGKGKDKDKKKERDARASRYSAGRDRDLQREDRRQRAAGQQRDARRAFLGEARDAEAPPRVQRLDADEAANDLQQGGAAAQEATTALQAMFRKLATKAGDPQRVEWADFEEAVGVESSTRLAVALPMLEEAFQPTSQHFKIVGDRLYEYAREVDAPGAAAKAEAMRVRLLDALDNGMGDSSTVIPSPSTSAHAAIDGIACQIAVDIHDGNTKAMDALPDTPQARAFKDALRETTTRFGQVKQVVDALNVMAVSSSGSRYDQDDLATVIDRTYLLTPSVAANQALITVPPACSSSTCRCTSATSAPRPWGERTTPACRRAAPMRTTPSMT